MMMISGFIFLLLSIVQIILLGSRFAAIAPQPLMACRERFFVCVLNIL